MLWKETFSVRQRFLFFILLALVSSFELGAATPELGIRSGSQDGYENSIEAVVKGKRFYKSGKFEIGGVAGVMPYDSLVNHYMLGGRLTWHFADHYGWEILDGVLTFPSTTGYTSNTVVTNSLSNLQTNRIRMLFTSNFLLSPIHGKFRFPGSSVLHFDVYFVLGAGMAKNDNVRYSNASGSLLETELGSTFDPVFDVGMGFKMFLNNAMSLTLDLRDYVLYATRYGSKRLGSNYSVFVGLSFFLPTF